jgi:hypothetical protein
MVSLRHSCTARVAGAVLSENARNPGTNHRFVAADPVTKAVQEVTPNAGGAE